MERKCNIFGWGASAASGGADEVDSHRLTIAQLAEHLTVVDCRYQSVLGSIPSGEIGAMLPQTVFSFFFLVSSIQNYVYPVFSKTCIPTWGIPMKYLNRSRRLPEAKPKGD